MTQDNLDLPSYAQKAYMQYALAVVKGRALSTVADGLKPVQLRILYAMQQLGLKHPAKAVKSARVVGDVLGKYHPHGDSSVYDALVRMAQPFTLRYPLVDGQGNFGSLDGDSAAAMRYTEARLSPLAELLLSEISMGTVDWAANYDGTLKEPMLCPARLPQILLNGSMGIAVGMAADIPSHNLREVAAACEKILLNPGVTLDELLEVLPGPDFPGGGQLVSGPSDIRAAYACGRGSLRCRGRWVREDLARGQWQIVINQMPYQVSTRKILEELDVLTNPQPPSGKKSITQQQANLKSVALDFLEKAVDESDKDSGIRLVLTPRSSKSSPDDLMTFLLANTSLEDRVPLNNTLISLDGNPGTKGLLAILGEWSVFRINVVRRRTQFELEGAQKRIHVLEGRLAAFINIDAIVRIIREVDEPKPELMARFSLSDIQADDILDMRLRQLNKLEGLKLERELGELRKEEARLMKLLASEPAMRALIVSEVRADALKYGDDRRTLIKPEQQSRNSGAVKSVLEEPITVVVSKNLWVKAYKGHALPEEAFSFKSSDGAWAKVETVTTRSTVVLDNKGRVYSFESAGVPAGRGEGVPLSTLIEIQDNASPFALLAGADDALYLFSNDRGLGFVASFKGLMCRPKAGKEFAKLEEGESLLAPVLVPKSKAGFVVMASTEHRLLAFGLEEVKELAKGGKGVALMDSGDGKVLKAWFTAEPSMSLNVRHANGKVTELVLQGETWVRHVSKRGRKGSFLGKKQTILG
jgi:topoisomerase-4 subunit A